MKIGFRNDGMTRKAGYNPDIIEVVYPEIDHKCHIGRN
jgi:hypothetical protein